MVELTETSMKDAKAQATPETAIITFSVHESEGAKGKVFFGDGTTADWILGRDGSTDVGGASLTADDYEMYVIVNKGPNRRINLGLRSLISKAVLVLLSDYDPVKTMVEHNILASHQILEHLREKKEFTMPDQGKEEE